MRGMQQSALIIIMPGCPTHKLKIAIGFMDKKKNGRAIQHMLTSEASLVAIERVTGKADRGFRHDAWLA
jgi:hypothetical protein